MWGTSFNEPISLGVLLAIAFVMFASQAHLGMRTAGGIRFDASYAIATIALVVGGPVPAFVIWVLPEIVGRVVIREISLFTTGFLATAASFGLGVLGGDAVLALADTGAASASAPGLFAAGVAVWAINIAIVGPVYDLFETGAQQACRTLREDLLPHTPAVLGILALAAVSWLLVPLIGYFAFILLALVVLTPQHSAELIARGRSIGALGEGEATRLYADAIAVELGVTADDRRLLATASQTAPRSGEWNLGRLSDELAAWIVELGSEGSDPEAARSRLATVVSLRSEEAWESCLALGDASAGTAALGGILRCARRWSSMTAADTAMLGHEQAMLALALESGTSLDPEAVEAAAAVVAREGRLTPESTDFQPRLHRLPLPRGVRRAAYSLAES